MLRWKVCRSDASVYNSALPQADRVLCDVPCSGIGVIRRKPEIRYKNPESFANLPAIQAAILETASRYVKVGGTLMYSTCTIRQEENADVVTAFLAKHSEFVPQPVLPEWGGKWAESIREIGPERIAEIDMAVSKWRSEGGFRDSNLTLSSFARRIMVNRTDVASYLTSIYGKNFRTWLSGIRVEEAKALMAAHPEYSNEVVSMECGFSSRVYFQRLFKERTGLTPAEWRRQR